MDPPREPSPPPAWRAPLIGALLIPVGAFCAVYAYAIIQAIHWSQQSLKLGPVFLLAILVGANSLLQRLRRAWSLTAGEMALVYSMLVVSTAIGGIGMVQFHVTGLPAPFYADFRDFARFRPSIPPLLSPQDPDAAREFFRGSATLYSPHVVRAWALPALFWTGFLVLLAWIMLCMNTLLRRQWIDQERLTFPLVQLPLEMVRDGGSSPFWTNRLMWAGFLLAGAAESVNSLNWFYPVIPSLPIKPTRWEQAITETPWSGMGMLAVAFYPFAIGIAYLLTLEVSFSCWFFYLLSKAELVLATALGWKEPAVGPVTGHAPYVMEQGAGAFIALALFALWTARRSLLATWRGALRGTQRPPNELMSYRLAWFGTIGGIGVATGLWSWLGLDWRIALALFVLYFLFQVTITRIVVEAGAGWHFAPTFNAHQMIFSAVGIHGFGPRGLTLLAYLSWIDLDYRDSPMPHQLEGMKLAQQTGVNLHRLFWALLAAAALGALCAYWANLHIYYQYGAATAKVRPWITTVGQQPFRQLRDWMNNPRPADWTGLQAALGGAGVTALLALARQRYVWWPFHPIGYALANTQSLDYMWAPFFIAWALKAGVLRYGGMRLYRQTLPFFLGLILGDYLVPALWFVYGWCLGIQTYLTFPH
jgi:hypothetical protein